MRGYKVGDVIKQRREAMGITQEELCLGIFDVSTLSRIENNKHFPSAKSITAIVERLDLSLDRFMVLFTEEDFQIQELCSEIIDYNVVREFDKAAELIERLEKLPHANENVIRQFIARSKTAAMKTKISQDEFILAMTEVIKITIPNYDEEKLENYFLNSEEIKCITGIANAYAEKGERRHAIKIYEKLLKVLNRSYKLSDERAKAIPPISYSLSRNLNLERRFEEAIEVCDAARQICIKKRRYDLLPDLLMNIGCAFAEQGLRSEAHRLFETSYTLFMSFEKFNSAQRMLIGIEKDYGITITNHLDNLYS